MLYLIGQGTESKNPDYMYVVRMRRALRRTLSVGGRVSPRKAS
jgi:hypothetical protein